MGPSDSESTSDQGFDYVSKLFMVGMLTVVSYLIGQLIIESAYNIDDALGSRALALSTICFFIGSILIVFLGASKINILVWFSGFAVAIGIYTLGLFQFVVVLMMLYPLETIGVSAIISILSWYFYRQFLSQIPQPASVPEKSNEVISFSRMKLSKKVHIGGVELVQLPEEHLTQTSDPKRYRPFLDLLRALTLANIPVTFRLERKHGKTRVFYLTWAKDERLLSDYIVRLEDNLQGNLTGMKFTRCSEFSGSKLDPQTTGMISYLRGEPLSIEDESQKQDALTVMASVLQQLPNGVIQISATPKRMNKRKLRSLEDKYRAEIARSERVISTPKTTFLSGEVHESTTKVDPDAQRKAASLAKQIERLSAQHLCEVRVAAACWDTNKAIAEENSKRLMTTLGNLVPADKNKSLTVETRSDIREMTQLLRGNPTGKTTLLSIEEAAIFFVIPSCDLGIPVVDHATFSSNPASLNPQKQEPVDTTKPSLCLGKILDESGREIGEFRIPIEDIPTHTGTFGDIGTGKSSTQIAITLELRKHGINTLTLLVSKNEDHIRMIRSDKNIRVLTLGDETMSPARFSLTSMTEGIHVNQIINSIKTLFVAAKPTDGIIKEYLEKVIELTFKRLGWDRATNTRGIPIVLQDFVETLPLIEQELQYSSRGNEDFRGALYGRFTSVCEGVLRSIFGTTSGRSIEELVSKSYIILLDKLSVEERSFFMFWLVNSLALHFEAKKKTDGPSEVGLKYYVVLEEAHRTLKRDTHAQIEVGHGAHQVALETICVTMTESRSSGLGFGLVTPDASQLALTAVKMPLNVFVHKTNAVNDRQLIGRQINCNDEQIAMIGSLQRGVAVVRLASNAKPLLVRINNPLDLYPELKPDIPVTDDEIMKHMEPFNESHPHFKTSSDFTDRIPKIQELSLTYASQSLDTSGLSRLYTMFSLPYFKKLTEILSDPKQIRKSLFVAILIRDIAAAASLNAEVHSSCHSHLIWTLWKTITSWSIEYREAVISDLESLVEIERESLLIDSDLINQRVMMEMKSRRSSSAVGKELKQLLKDAIRHTTSEFKALQRKESSKEKSTPIDTESFELIDAIVRTKDFASRYKTRVEKAVDGDCNSLLRLLEAFSKKLVTPSQPLADVQSNLLERARVIHKIPTDDSLWETITSAYRNSSTEQRSESAA